MHMVVKNVSKYSGMLVRDCLYPEIILIKKLIILSWYLGSYLDVYYTYLDHQVNQFFTPNFSNLLNWW